MDPYVKGALLRRELKPKQLRLPPDEVHLGPGAVDFLEWSILRRCVHTWLEYLAWYAQQSVHPLLNLGLMVQTSWKIKDEDPHLRVLCGKIIHINLMLLLQIGNRKLL